MAGASISKIFIVFKHMGMYMYGVRSYFKHQKMFLFPVILSHWESYQGALIQKLIGMSNVVWSGDGGFVSMGHSAKYGVYTKILLGTPDGTEKTPAMIRQMSQHVVSIAKSVDPNVRDLGVFLGKQIEYSRFVNTTWL